MGTPYTSKQSPGFTVHGHFPLSLGKWRISLLSFLSIPLSLMLPEITFPLWFSLPLYEVWSATEQPAGLRTGKESRGRSTVSSSSTNSKLFWSIKQYHPLHHNSTRPPAWHVDPHLWAYLAPFLWWNSRSSQKVAFLWNVVKSYSVLQVWLCLGELNEKTIWNKKGSFTHPHLCLLSLVAKCSVKWTYICFRDRS